jgi:hypothetical protein
MNCQAGWRDFGYNSPGFRFSLLAAGRRKAALGRPPRAFRMNEHENRCGERDISWRSTTSLLAAVMAALWLPLPVRAVDEKDARTIIDKGIAAAGGEERIARFTARTYDENGTDFDDKGNGIPYTAKCYWQMPGQWRLDASDDFIIVIDGDKGWRRHGGTTEDLTKDELKQRAENLYYLNVTRLVPLKNPGYTLTALGESKDGDQIVNGVKISHAGRADIKLYFDKTSGLLVKGEHRIKDDQKEVDQEIWYQNYVAIEGMTVPSKITMKYDGKPYIESKLSNIQPVHRLASKRFAKP